MGESAQPSLFEQLGGEPVLRSVIRTFVDRMFSDPMIGYLFRKASRERVAEKEYELAAQHLGAGDVVYTGKPLGTAHAAHRILEGQFARRLHILRTTLEEAGAPPAVIAHWLGFTERLRPLVLGDDSACAP
jgi:truncated hemoglobin YjbI